MKQKFKISVMSCWGNMIHECKDPSEPIPDRPSSTAQKLALAHYLERQIEAGKIRNSAEAAQILGISRGWMSQVMSLRYLSPSIQALILSGEIQIQEKVLRKVMRFPSWELQMKFLKKRGVMK